MHEIGLEFDKIKLVLFLVEHQSLVVNRSINYLVNDIRIQEKLLKKFVELLVRNQVNSLNRRKLGDFVDHSLVDPLLFLLEIQTP